MRAHSEPRVDAQRWGLRIRGTVQGVGFRPAVYRVACALGLSGWVRNDGAGVWIELEGEAGEIERFAARLVAEAPPLARIDGIAAEVLPPAPFPERGFHIAASIPDDAATCLPPDTAPCAECLRELFDPRDRHYRYPFLSCTGCGPRYSIASELPYDRPRTSLRDFALCTDCLREYHDPESRRFHAEAIACPACGPRLRLFGRDRPSLVGDEALSAAATALWAGGIVAVRGVGGFLLACDARNGDAVARLRARKARPHQPLAVMARDLGWAEELAVLDETAQKQLVSPVRPIVILPARPRARLAAEVAPGLRQLGLMLPSTPLHHLLLSDGPPLQVMTSGNRSGEPLAAEEAEATARLSGIADVFLSHDRRIETRLDDSVVRIVAGLPQPVRRARGLTPQPIALPFASGPLVAVGAESKSTVCLVRGSEAFVSQHLGDLSHPLTGSLFASTIESLGRLHGVAPRLVAHDLHPDYRSTRWALASGLPRHGVQHHHAHLAACLVEHGRTGPALGVAFDGTGCGPAGELWGGELLDFDLTGFHRLAHVRALPLPGGEAAIRQPWRLAAAALLEAGEPLELLARAGARSLEQVRQLVAASAVSGVGAPRATSVGRWFDAVSALCAVRDEVTYEGQAAIELEAQAEPGEPEPYPYQLGASPGRGALLEIDLRPAVRAIAAELRAGVPVRQIAARFHETLAQATALACVAVRERARSSSVVLSGGCFQNARLSERLSGLLERAGFEVLVHRRVPPNDGGLSLGQAAIAAYARRTDVSRHSR